MDGFWMARTSSFVQHAAGRFKTSHTRTSRVGEHVCATSGAPAPFAIIMTSYKFKDRQMRLILLR